MLSKTPEPISEAKLTVIGKSQSGKSALISRYVNKTFLEPKKTIGVSFSMKLSTIGKRQIKLRIWDTAGEERYQICDRHSFEQVESFLQLAQKECQDDTYILLIGTECDEHGKREVAYDEADAFARGHGLLYIETSAKENIKVTEAFELAGKETLERPDLEFPEESRQRLDSSCSIF